MIRTIIVGTLVLFSSSLNAWQKDVHYGLVKWIAVEAGFNINESEIIADGSYMPDDSVFMSAIEITMASCKGPISKLPAGFVIETHHYPNDGDYPGLPEKRVVVPVSTTTVNAANRDIVALINYPPVNPIQPGPLRRLGALLHPLADSWSHQGIPDVPEIEIDLFVYKKAVRCDENYFWGHPVKRGGWNSHDADITHLHEDDTVESARNLFHYLCKYRGCKNSFSGIEPKIRQFANASTIQEKENWFREYAGALFDNYDFVQSLSLDTTATTTYQYAETNREISDFISSDVELFARSFMNRLLVERNFDEALNMIDIESVTQPFFNAYPGIDNVSPADWVLSQLRLIMLADHGFVNEVNHGYPVTSELVNILADREDFQIFTSLADSLEPVNSDLLYLFLPDVNNNSDGNHALIFLPRHSQGDMVIVVINDQEGMQIKRIFQTIID